jgi:Kinesin motor domain
MEPERSRLDTPKISRNKRRSFISSEDPEIPQLVKQKSDVKLSKKGTNVFVRFRPDNERENEGRQCVDYFPDLKTVSVENHSFRFKRVFSSETTQDQVFMNVGVPLIEPILDGYNCGLLAYGQTGGGKTFTLLGHGFDQPDRIGNSDPEKRGIAPRLLQSLFHQMQSNMTPLIAYSVYTSFIQIYLEKIYDLLNPAKEKLKVYEDVNKGLWLTDATNVPVKNAKEILKQMEMGIKYRVTAPTLSNAESSRAHAVLILTINKDILNEAKSLSSQVYLVDLCGSERISKTGAVEERLKEAQNINKSLLALGNIIGALVENKKHIPYRDSKLTRLLQNCFGGSSITSLILCCSSNSLNSVETLATLRFGDRANKVKNKPVRNMGDSVPELKRLLNEAHSKLFTQQRILRSQTERIIELETITRELISICGESRVGALRARYQIKIESKLKHGFEKIGYNLFNLIFSYLTPLEALCLIKVNKLFSKRVKSDVLWKFYSDLIIQSKVSFYNITKESLQKIETDNWFKYISELAAMKNQRNYNPSSGRGSGVTLFHNRHS